MPVAVSLCPQAHGQVPWQAGTLCGTLVGLARTVLANYSPFPRKGTGEREYPLAAPHVFACTGERSFYEGCIGKGADVTTHQASLALQSPQTPK